VNRGRKPSWFFRTDVFDHVRNHGFFRKLSQYFETSIIYTQKVSVSRVSLRKILLFGKASGCLKKKNALFHRVGG
jgi:hypothetical protein